MIAHCCHFLRGCAIEPCKCQLAKRTKELQLQTMRNEVHTDIIQLESKARKERKKERIVNMGDLSLYLLVINIAVPHEWVALY